MLQIFLLIYFLSICASIGMFIEYIKTLNEYSSSERGIYVIPTDYPKRYMKAYFIQNIIFSIFPIVNTINAIYFYIKMKLLEKYDYNYTLIDYIYDKFIIKGN